DRDGVEADLRGPPVGLRVGEADLDGAVPLLAVRSELLAQRAVGEPDERLQGPPAFVAVRVDGRYRAGCFAGPLAAALGAMGAARFAPALELAVGVAGAVEHAVGELHRDHAATAFGVRLRAASHVRQRR